MICFYNLGLDSLNIMLLFFVTAKRLCAPDPYQGGSATATANQQDPGDPSQPGRTHPSDLPDQDLPLSFDQSRLAIAVAVSRGVFSGQLSETNTLAHVLHNSLPNLHSSALAQISGPPEEKDTKRSTCSEQNDGKTEHVLGLGCYSSFSDEET